MHVCMYVCMYSPSGKFSSDMSGKFSSGKKMYCNKNTVARAPYDLNCAYHLRKRCHGSLPLRNLRRGLKRRPNGRRWSRCTTRMRVCQKSWRRPIWQEQRSIPSSHDGETKARRFAKTRNVVRGLQCTMPGTFSLKKNKYFSCF